jgi:sigma-E factor negative regulatory protein RseC
MIEQVAEVVRVEGQTAWVIAQASSSCGSCSSGGCGTGSLQRYFSRRAAPVAAENLIGARVGQRVVVGLEEGAMVQGSLLLYMVPLLAFLIAAATIEAVLADEIAALIGGAVAMAITVRAVRRYTTTAADRFGLRILRLESSSLSPINFFPRRE